MFEFPYFSVPFGNTNKVYKMCLPSKFALSNKMHLDTTID